MTSDRIDPGEAFAAVDSVALIRSLPDPVLLLAADDRYTIVEASDSYLSATMSTRAGLVGRPLFEAFPDDDPRSDGVRNLRASLDAVVAEGRRDDMPVQRYPVPRSVDAGGGFEERFWLPVNVPVHDRTGSVTHVLHRVTDVTDVVRQETSHARSSELLGIVERIARVGGWYADLLTGELTWSDMVREIHEVDADFEPDLEHGLEFYAPGSQALIRSRFEAAAVRGQRFDEDLVIISRTGRHIPVRALGEAVRDADGQIIAVQGAFQDLTAVRELEAALTASQGRFRQLAEALNVVVWTSDAQGAVDYANRAFWDLIGLEPAQIDLPSGEWVNCLHPDDVPTAVQTWADSVSAGAPYSLHFRIRRHDGLYRMHSVSGTPIRDVDGRIVRWYGTAIDVDEALVESERARHLAEELSLTIQSMTEGFFALDSQWTFLLVNPAAATLLQRRPEDLIGRNMWAEFPEGRDTIAWERYHEALASGLPQRFELDYAPLDIELEITAYPRGERLVVFLRDVTEARRSRRQLVESEARFRAVAHTTTDAVWDWDLVQGRVWWSGGVEALLGVAPDQMPTAGPSWVSFLHPDDAHAVLDSLHAAIDSGPDDWQREYRVVRTDGAIVPVLDRGRVIRADDGTPVRMVGGIVDLSERYASQERIAEQARLLDEANDAIIVRSLDHRVRYWNAGAERLYGWSRHEALGRDVRTLIYTEGSVASFEAGTSATLSVGHWTGRLDQRARDGRVIPVQTHWTHVQDVFGVSSAILAINRDISEELALQMQLERIQRLEVLGQLTGGVAHDFNNLLTVIMGAADLLGDRLPPATPERELVATVERAAQRGADLTQRLLLFARRQPLKAHPRNVNDVVDGVRALMAQSIGENIRIDYRLDPSVAGVVVDQAQLEACLMNLAVNARDAMPDGGRITIETANVHLDGDRVDLGIDAPAGPYVVVSVTDSGVGMEPEVRDRAFEPFFTTKAPGMGTGLGLSMAYGFVKQSGGHLTLYSEPGRGTTVRMYFPATSRPPERDVPRVETVRRGGGQHILVVEDNDLVRANVVEQLLSLNYRVSAVGSAAEALTLAADGADIEAVFTDVVMPGMDGLELAARLRDRSPGVPVLFTSGYTEHAIVDADIPEGSIALLSKPYSRRDLARALEDLLDSNAGSERR